MVDFERNSFELALRVEMLDPFCQCVDKLFRSVSGWDLEQVLSPSHDSVVCIVNKLDKFLTIDTVNRPARYPVNDNKWW